jgi:DNA-binding XRE family transcriptional regulator
MHLKQYLDNNGIQYKVFAKKIGISLFTMQALLHKRRYPKYELALKIGYETSGAVNLYDWSLNEKVNDNPPKKTKKKSKYKINK